MATFVFRRCLSCNIGSVIPNDQADQIKHKCKECKTIGKWQEREKDARKHCGIIIPDSGWESQNSGRGHYFSQLEDKPSTKKSPHAFCRSAKDFKEKCARRGLKVTRDGY